MGTIPHSQTGDSMRPGEYYATCKRYRENHRKRSPDDRVFCDEEFHDYASTEAHIKNEHPSLYKKRYRDPKPLPMWSGRAAHPSVKPDKQQVTPGEFFVHQGYTCQIIGHTSPDNARFLAWLPPSVDPRNNSAVKHGEIDDLVVWEMKAPVEKLVRIISEDTE